MNSTETILRRFDPGRTEDPKHMLFDESIGSWSLAAGALRFDNDGCSVFREGALRSANLDAQSIVGTGSQTGIAEATKEEVDQYTHSSQSGDCQPFEVIASPVDDLNDGFEGRLMKAHASLVYRESTLSNNQKKRAASGLAKRVFRIRTPEELRA